MALESNTLDWPGKSHHAPSREELRKWRVTVVLQAFQNLASSFHLPPTRITLKEILKESGARKALNDLGNRAEAVSRVDIEQVLENTLPIVPLLPRSYPHPHEGARRIQRRQARNRPRKIRRWADELEKALRVDQDRSQAALDKGSPPGASSEDFAQLPDKLRQYAEFLDERLSHTRLVSYGSRNPQLRAAVLLSTFIKAATGRFGDIQFAVLLQSAFHASRKEPPSWIDRLNLERKRQAKRLKRLWEMSLPSQASLR